MEARENRHWKKGRQERNYTQYLHLIVLSDLLMFFDVLIEQTVEKIA